METKLGNFQDLGLGVRAGIINITPKQAEIFLKNSEARPMKNRAVRDGKVSQMTIDIEQGRWRLNGETLVFDENDRLMDGQHRCRAIVGSGISCLSVVIKGIPSEVFESIDTGSNRSARDVLSIIGLQKEKASRLSTLIPQIFHHEKGRVATAWNAYAPQVDGHARLSRTPGLPNQAHKDRQKLTNADILEYYDQHKQDLDDIYDFCVKYQKSIKKVFPFSTFMLMFYVLRKINLYDAQEFCSLLATGELLKNDNPIYVLRERFISIMSNNTEKIPGWHYAALTFKAWNAFRYKKPMSRLFILSSESAPVKPI